MTTVTARLLDDALSLPEDERAGLAAELLASLAPTTRAEARSEDEWLAEIERRARAALAGSPGLSWKAARAEIERRRKARR
jgi:hypothetical protein